MLSVPLISMLLESALQRREKEEACRRGSLLLCHDQSEAEVPQPQGNNLSLTAPLILKVRSG